MLIIENISKFHNKYDDQHKERKIKTISFYINPITDINILKQELKELKEVNNNISLLNKDIEYISLFNMELSYFEEIHKQVYSKSNMLIDNNNCVIITPEFKKYCSLIKREIRKIIKKLQKLKNKPDKKE